VIEIWLIAALLVLASLAIGAGLMAALGARQPGPLAGAVGFAALVTVAPIAVRLPGRGVTAGVLVVLLAAACAWFIWRRRERVPEAGARADRRIAVAAAVLVVLVASLPFLFNERAGVLGEGIYTNDHAAQLYWADWLAEGFGPRPNAVAFGYPVGPQALAAASSALTGINLVAAFNGLLLAIPALTALAALGALGGLRRWARVPAAALVALPYLAASFLAQSAFKETAMALFVVAFAVALGAAELRPRARAGAIVLLGAGAVFTYSIPGVAWFGVALAIWVAVKLLAGELDGALRRVAAALGRHRGALALAALLALAVAAVALEPAREFLRRVDDIGLSRGRLSSPVFPGEAFGIWPEGDFRVVRGEVPGSLLASGFAGLCVLVAGLATARRREWALAATLAAAGLIYIVARPFTEIHVEAKALAVLAPIAMLVTLRWFLAPAQGRVGAARLAIGVLFAALAATSTFLALRAAPIGFDERQQSLERLAERAEGERLVFLGVDRFAAYYLRGTLIESPAGFVPPSVKARPEKAWQLGTAVDFDTLKPRKLDRFDYAITPAAAYASTPPPNWREVARDGDYVLWERRGRGPNSLVLPDEGGDPGVVFDCEGRHARFNHHPGTALVLPTPVVLGEKAWSPQRAFAAPGSASVSVPLEPGTWRISLQYHSQVPLSVYANGELVAELPPSLEGIYLSHEGRGAFWPAGELDVDGDLPGEVEVEVRAPEPSGLQRLLGVERRVWLGTLTFTEAGDPAEVPLAQACGRYVDRFVLRD
jgi:hypothetical protein